MEDWAEIRRLHRAEGMVVKAIARRLGVARNTVRSALRSAGPPSYERQPKGSIVDAVEPQILELLRDCPDMAATVMAERIGWERSVRVLRERVAELRPLFVAPDPCQRTTYRPGELAQFDLWQPDVEIPLGYGQAAKCWVIVGVSGFSRFLGAWMIPSRQAHDVLGGHLRALRQFGACPGPWSGTKRAPSASGGVNTWPSARTSSASGGHLASVPGCASGAIPRPRAWWSGPTAISRPASCPDGASRRWVTSTANSAPGSSKANNRIHATTKVRPREAMAEDRGSMLAFPPVLPDTSLRWSTRLPRDHYVRVDTNDYSVNPRFVGRRVQVQVDLDTVVATCEGTEVARHRRCLARHQSLLAPEHSRILRAMRVERAATEALRDAVEERDLAVYDRITEVA